MLGNWLKPVQILWNVKCWHPRAIFDLLVYFLYVSECKEASPWKRQVSKVILRTFIKYFVSKISGGLHTKTKGSLCR